VLAGTSFNDLQEQWFKGYARATFSHQSAFFMTVKRLDGTIAMKADAPRADTWRVVDFTKPKWGTHRSFTDKPAVNPGEDTVRFANIAITPGPTPGSDCHTK
jgi:hypothetical protein